MSHKYDIGFFSSADRGLDCLLDMIPKIEEQLGRKVKSCWAYGWNTFDGVHSKNPEMMKWKWNVIRKMNAVGMDDKGRLSHEDLARLMKDTKVWAYPTEFTEIHCITALKAQEAGCIPVVTGVAALKETVRRGNVINSANIYTDQNAQKDFIAKCILALNNHPLLIDAGEVHNRYWPDVAKVWGDALSN